METTKHETLSEQEIQEMENYYINKKQTSNVNEVNIPHQGNTHATFVAFLLLSL